MYPKAIDNSVIPYDEFINQDTLVKTSVYNSLTSPFINVNNQLNNIFLIFRMQTQKLY